MKTRDVRKGIDRILEGILIGLMAVNVLNVLWQVATRFIFRSPSPFTEELARFLLIWVGLLGAAYAAGKKLHPAIEVVADRFPPRGRFLICRAVHLLVFLFAGGVMVVGGTRLVWITLKLNQISAALRIKLGYIYLVLPLSGILIMFYAWEALRQPEEPLEGDQISGKAWGSEGV
jgi:TRAP-type C4-dicarboxylate transport system permease small subunit